jgi:hypothetical protein
MPQDHVLRSMRLLATEVLETLRARDPQRRTDD